MADRKKAGPKSAAAKSMTKTSQAGVVQPSPTIEISYRRAPEFRHTISDSCLVSADNRNAVITFYLNDRDFETQEAKLVKSTAGQTTYQTGPLVEKYFRLLQSSIHMPILDAVKMANLILEKARQVAPDSISLAAGDSAGAE